MFKRYLVFGGENCYPNGGFGDLMNSFDDKQEAMNKVENNLRNGEVDDNNWKWFDWGQVVDKDNGDVWHYMVHKLENKKELEYKWTNGANKLWH